jgi:hypothetical protein
MHAMPGQNDCSSTHVTRLSAVLRLLLSSAVELVLQELCLPLQAVPVLLVNCQTSADAGAGDVGATAGLLLCGLQVCC